MEYTVHEGTKITCKPSKFFCPLWTDEAAGIHFVHSTVFHRKVCYDMGYKVRAVLRSGPAYEAGIRNGDEILSFGGKGNLTPKSLTKLIRACSINQTITVRVKARGDIRNRNVRLSSVKRNGKAVPSLGVITKKSKANAYNTKVARRLRVKVNMATRAGMDDARSGRNAKKKVVVKKATMAAKVKAKIPFWPGQKASTPDVIDELKAVKPAAKENHFRRQAREEMSAVLQLVEDLEGADALKEAKDLRRKLRAENLRSMDRATEIVNEALKALGNKKKEEEVAENAHLDSVLEKKGWRLSRIGKVLFKTTAAVLSVAGVTAAITFAVQSYPFF